MQKILIVEDDVIICGGIRVYLENNDYEAVCAYSIKEAETALKEPFDLMILDINLPDGSGLDFCTRLRQQTNMPIIFLTANDTEENMLEGFRHGCDDYIAKPFSVEILLQRLKAVLRRSREQQTDTLFVYGDLSVDFAKMQVLRGDDFVKLSATEFRLLELLIRNKGQVLTRNQILDKIWDCNENYVDENTLNVHIRRIRQKIENDPQNPKCIITVFGIGYTFGE